jgi:hypothetical protein
MQIIYFQNMKSQEIHGQKSDVPKKPDPIAAIANSK